MSTDNDWMTMAQSETSKHGPGKTNDPQNDSEQGNDTC